MNRAGRLQTGKMFIENYPGKKIVKGYSKWYGVSLLTAVIELKILGVTISEEYITQLEITEENKIKQRQKRKEEKALQERLMEEESESESDYWDFMSEEDDNELFEDISCNYCENKCVCVENQDLPF